MAYSRHAALDGGIHPHGLPALGQHLPNVLNCLDARDLLEDMAGTDRIVDDAVSLEQLDAMGRAAQEKQLELV